MCTCKNYGKLPGNRWQLLNVHTNFIVEFKLIESLTPIGMHRKYCKLIPDFKHSFGSHNKSNVFCILFIIL